MRSGRYFFLVALATLVSCGRQGEIADRPATPQSGSARLKYAEGFSISRDSSFTWVEVTAPYPGSHGGYKYLLVPKGVSVPQHDADVRVIRTPVSSIVCTSTSHIPLLDYLDQTDKLTGFPTTDYISSDKMRQRVDRGKVIDVGVDNGLNVEVISALKPELLMGYTMTAEYGQFKKIEELGIPVVINADYLEKHPLGRAEWIKFAAVFFGEEDKADSVFTEIERDYLQTKQLASGLKVKPTILTGIMYGDAWFLPGGKNYASTILADAGYAYPWNDDPSTGFIELSFETVFLKAHACDYWIGVGPFQSRNEIKAADDRYAQFDAFTNNRVFSYDARKGAKGGNEYLELGYLRPDIILRDLVKISHPELLPEHKLFFYRRLE
jgi:iron complex transport system substrate-binding protein